jgi:hypothetical protein
MVSVPRLGRVHPVPAGIVAVVLAGVGGALALGGRVPPLELAAFAFATLALLVETFDRTRADPRADVVKLALLTGAFTALYASPPRAVFEAVLAGLAVLGLVVETYNLLTGSTLLRLGTAGSDDEDLDYDP